MAIEKKLIHFSRLSDFETQLNAGNILDYSIVFIQDAKKIWTHSQYYDCNGGSSVDLSEYLTADEIAEIYATTESLNGKQDTLVPGTNIKTINGESILGKGDLTIESGAKVYHFDLDAAFGAGAVTQDAYDAIIAADVVKYNGLLLNNSVDDGTILLHAASATISDTGDVREIAPGVLSFTIGADLSFTYDYGFASIPTKTSQLTNDSNFISSDNLKTINGENIVGSGDITIEGGSSSGSSAYSEVSHGTTDTTFILTPNTFHIWDEVSSLTLTLGAETSGVANEYLFQFTSGSTATTLSLPDDIKWTGGETPTIEANKIYQISILKGLGSVLEWDNAPLSITFFVQLVGSMHPYYCLPGMTWQEFVNSEYNVGTYILQIFGDSIGWGSFRITGQNITDVIIDGAQYTTYYAD